MDSTKHLVIIPLKVRSNGTSRSRLSRYCSVIIPLKVRSNGTWMKRGRYLVHMEQVIIPLKVRSNGTSRLCTPGTTSMNSHNPFESQV